MTAISPNHLKYQERLDFIHQLLVDQLSLPEQVGRFCFNCLINLQELLMEIPNFFLQASALS